MVCKNKDNLRVSEGKSCVYIVINSLIKTYEVIVEELGENKVIRYKR